MPKPIDAKIFREYDIRGVFEQNLWPENGKQIGAAYGQFLRQNTAPGADLVVNIGYDGRLSTPVLLRNLLAGLIYAGVTPVLVGLGPTPMLYYSVFAHAAAGGIMITGSHNPKTHNGFKMLLAQQSLHGEQIQAIGKIAATIDAAQIPDFTGTVLEKPVLADYVRRLAQALPSLSKPLRVVWDAGNGAAGAVLPELVKKLPGRHTVLHADVDGNFPNHHPDPSVAENMRDLQQRVLADGADIGFAFDGDGDRLGVVDNRGRIFWGDQILLYLAQGIAPHYPGQPIIADVKCSQILFDGIAKAGARPVIWKTGHSLIKAKMRELSAPLAGEMSGHIFIKDQYYGFDDGIYAAIRCLGYLAAQSGSMAEWFDHLPQIHNTPEMRLECSEEQKFAIIESVRRNLRDAGIDFMDIDGVRATTKDGWWLLRASNTQPVLALRAESHSAEGLVRLTGEIERQLQQAGVKMRFAAGH